MLGMRQFLLGLIRAQYSIFTKRMHIVITQVHISEPVNTLFKRDSTKSKHSILSHHSICGTISN